VEVEAQHERGELKPSAYGLALQAAQDAVEQARRALEGAEAGQGWLSLTPERVEEKLAQADVETLRSFIREQVRVLVYPVGRGNRVPVEKRISVFYLTAGKGTDPAETVEPPVPVPGVKTPKFRPVSVATEKMFAELIAAEGFRLPNEHDPVPSV
jgi:hypothetical protein